MTILTQSPFFNQIETLKTDNAYHLRLVEENNNEIQKLMGADEMVQNFLALGKEAISCLKNIDTKYLEIVKEEVLLLFSFPHNSKNKENIYPHSIKSAKDIPASDQAKFEQQLETVDISSQTNNKTASNSDTESSISNSEDKSDRNNTPINSKVEIETQPAKENKSNDYLQWVETDNPHLAYYIRQPNNQLECAYIGGNNYKYLKSWCVQIQKIIPEVKFDLRKGWQLPYKYEIKLWNLTENDCQLLVDNDYANSPTQKASKQANKSEKSDEEEQTKTTANFVLADVKIGDKIKITKRYYNKIDYCGQWGEVIKKEYSLAYVRMPDGTEFGLAQNQFEVKQLPNDSA